MDPMSVVKKFAIYWGAQDVDRSMTLLADDAVWNLNISETTLPFAGETRGRENVKAAFFTILKDWDYLYFEPTFISAIGEIVRTHVDFRYRHRHSGLDLAGRYRVVFTVVDGEITRIDEFHDAAMVEAFMRLASRSQE